MPPPGEEVASHGDEVRQPDGENDPQEAHSPAAAEAGDAEARIAGTRMPGEIDPAHQYWMPVQSART
jgi:hypothetical protein